MAPAGSRPRVPAMVTVGIISGLLAALLQALSYLSSRHFLHTPGRDGLQLLALAQVWMGVASLPLLILMWQTPAGGVGAAVGPLGMAVGGYLGAQTAFFWTIAQVPASRIAPLLGIKIGFVAVLVTVIGLENLNLAQWLAVALTLVAAVAIQYAGEPLPARALGGVLATALCFALSDIGVRTTQLLFVDRDPVSASLLTLALTYACCLPLGAGLVLLRGGFRRQPWLASLPYATIWLLAMAALFSAFALAGVVLGVICQAMCGPLSLFLAVAVSKTGLTHIEVPQQRSAWWRQMGAALLMVVAIALFVYH
jgi:drug/metabolite transporter (DMT)-like permease